MVYSKNSKRIPLVPSLRFFRHIFKMIWRLHAHHDAMECLEVSVLTLPAQPQMRQVLSVWWDELENSGVERSKATENLKETVQESQPVEGSVVEGAC